MTYGDLGGIDDENITFSEIEHLIECWDYTSSEKRKYLKIDLNNNCDCQIIYYFVLMEKYLNKYVDILRPILNNYGMPVSTSTNSNCFVATVVYEDNNCFEVETLRRWRDSFLRNHYLGRVFIKYYYTYGEKLSLRIKPHKRIKRIIKLFLDWLIYKVIL